MRSLTFAAVLIFAGLLAPRASLGAAIVITDFESGTLAGWTFSGQGNAAALSGIGAINPLFGSQMAMLSSGPGDAGGALDQAVLLSDAVTLSAGDTLDFAIRRLTAEFTGTSSDPGHLDSFLVQLLRSGGPTVDLHSSDVSSSAFGPIPAAPIVAPGGDTFFDYSDWSTFSFNVTTTGSYRLSFTVQDAGDNSFDSAFLIDGGISTTVPEPGTIFTLLAGAAVVTLKLKRNRIRNARQAEEVQQ